MIRRRRRHPHADLLLEGRWLPVTRSMSFIRADPQTCIDVFEKRTGHVVLERFGSPRRVREVAGDGIEQLLAALLPLDDEGHRHLLVRTANPDWTAVFTNHWRGGRSHLAAQMGMGGLRVVTATDVPHTINLLRTRGDWGDRSLVLWEPWPERQVRHGTVDWMLHHVQAGVGDRGWFFHAGSGYTDERLDIPFPLGRVWDERALRAVHKFDHDHLVEACRMLGLRPFDADFYAPDAAGLILERSDLPAPDERSYTLAQARGEERVDR
ncbi:hypothetical protein [Cellulomonas pakistanensis]|uniref:Uncharacterized protein n=1 Tax=Cellulomonas pakistanensis TaxID=992287 RepID=A0A919P8D3_9CELL|nr:hypothetical protein [Cellulomonas pakistanensis]GIG36254.1 hypothetical protein Cpa01nite_16350 [Cellulomonas pakistanensis]